MKLLLDCDTTLLKNSVIQTKEAQVLLFSVGLLIDARWSSQNKKRLMRVGGIGGAAGEIFANSVSIYSRAFGHLDGKRSITLHKKFCLRVRHAFVFATVFRQIDVVKSF